MNVNVMIDTDDETLDIDLDFPAVPRIGDHIAFVDDKGYEKVYEVVSVVYRVHSGNPVAAPVVTCGYPD